MHLIYLLEEFLKSMIIGGEWKKKYFNKTLVMSEEDDERFQLSNKWGICDKVFDVEDDKVRDHCHITGKYRGSGHESCNVNLKLTKEVLVTFQNLRGCDSFNHARRR